MSPAARNPSKPKARAVLPPSSKILAPPATSFISLARKLLVAALSAKSRGVKIHIESVLPHLLLDKSFAERPGVEGMKHVMSPPLRAKHNQSILWYALANASIDTVGTDHCPFDTSQKLLGKDSFVSIPNGIPGIEDRVNLLYTYGVKTGRIDLDRFVDAASTRAAKLFGLFPRKGTIAVGSDADLVIYDPNYRGTISAKTQHTNNDYNGFEGMQIAGRPSIVTVRGKVQVRDGQFVGERGRGRMLKRELQRISKRATMTLDPKRTVAELKELRALTADENGAQRVAWTDTWLKAREWFADKLTDLPVEHHYDAAGNNWVTLRGDVRKISDHRRPSRFRSQRRLA